MAVVFSPLPFGDAIVLTTPAEYKIGWYTPSMVGKSALGQPYVRASSATALHEFTLTWRAILGAFTPNLEDMFELICTQRALFTDPESNDWNVIRHPDQDRLTLRMVKAGVDSDNWRWETEVRLIESP